MVSFLTSFFESAFFVLFIFGVASFVGAFACVVPLAYRAVVRGRIDKPGPFEHCFMAVGVAVFLATLLVVSNLFYISPGV